MPFFQDFALNSKTRAAIAAALLLTAAGCGKGSNSEADSQAQKIWDKLLTHCGDSYLYSESVFDASGRDDLFGVNSGPAVVEYEKAMFNLVPIEISDAERLNGLQYHGRMTMVATAYRKNGGAWHDGPAMKARDASDIMGQALKDVGGDMGSMGMEGAIALDLIEAKNEWVVGRSSVSLTGGLAGADGYRDVNKLPGLGPKQSCDALTQRVQKFVTDAATAQAKAERAAAEQKVWLTPGTIHDPEKGIPFLKVTEGEVTTIQGAFDKNGMWTAGGMWAVTKIVARYPVIPNDDQWLAPGTTFEAVPDLPALSAQNGSVKSFKLVKITSGPHENQPAIIELGSYGSFDMTRPGQVAAK